jgi:hypothetical protein
MELYNNPSTTIGYFFTVPKRETNIYLTPCPLPDFREGDSQDGIELSDLPSP